MLVSLLCILVKVHLPHIVTHNNPFTQIHCWATSSADLWTGNGDQQFVGWMVFKGDEGISGYHTMQLGSSSCIQSMAQTFQVAEQSLIAFGLFLDSSKRQSVSKEMDSQTAPTVSQRGWLVALSCWRTNAHNYYALVQNCMLRGLVSKAAVFQSKTLRGVTGPYRL